MNKILKIIRTMIKGNEETQKAVYNFIDENKDYEEQYKMFISNNEIIDNKELF